MPKLLSLDEVLQPRGSSVRLARRLRISVTYLCDIRKGRKEPSLSLAVDIHRETGVPIESLVRRVA